MMLTFGFQPRSHDDAGILSKPKVPQESVEEASKVEIYFALTSSQVACKTV